MGKGKNSKRKKRSDPDSGKQSSGRASLQSEGSPKRKCPPSHARSRSDRTSRGSESMDSASETSASVSHYTPSVAQPRSPVPRPAGNPPTPTKMKLPPLVVKDVPLNKLVSTLASVNAHAEYKLTSIGIKVVLYVKEDFVRVTKILKDSNMEFFTHDIPGEKPFKVVIRGLPNIKTEVIAAEITNRYKLVPTGVFRITRKNEGTRKHPDCLFLVHFQKGTVTLNALQAVRSLFSIIVRWEPYRGGHRDVTQCQRCLGFGHGTRNCNIAPRCSICAQNHLSSTCPVAEAAVFTCVNCGGAHQGSDRQCPKREEFKQIRKQASTNHQPGRNKKRAPPAFTDANFPALQTRGLDPKPSINPSVGQSSPPPGFRWQPTPPNNNSDLFSADELMEIFVNMSGALRKCRSKPEQIQVLGKFIIQYGC